MSDSNKNYQIVIMTVLAMICVVIGHCDITDDYKNLWIFKWVYSFHMPLFFFISGFLFALTNPTNKTEQGSTKKFLLKKVKRLYIPFLFINTIIFIIKASVFKDSNILQHPVNWSLQSFIDSTFFHPMGFMWFLPTLFFIFCIIFPIHKKTQRNHKTYTITLVIICIACGLFYSFIPTIDFLQISRGFYYCSYFILGVLYFLYKNSIDKYLRQYWYILLPIFILSSVSLIFPKYISAITGILMCVIIGLILEKKNNTTILTISEFCYTIFLLSYFPQMIIRGPIYNSFNDVNQYIFSIISFIAGIGIPLLIGLIIKRISTKNKYIKKLGFIFGI